MKAQICFALTFLFTIVSYAQWQGTDPITFIPPGIGGTSNGSTVTTGVLISCNQSGTSLNLGVDASTPQYSWIQSRDRDSDDMMNLAVNPWGGKVGIGTTAVPATKLEVNGSISMARGNRLQFLEGVGGANRAFIEGDANNQLLFHVGSGSGTDAMVINSAGNIGVGTLSPYNKLSIHSQGNSDLGIWTNLVSGEASVMFRNNATGRDGSIVYRSNGRMSFNLDANNASGIEANEYLTILNNGNTGIGAVNPATKLEVNGTLSMVRGNRIQFLETVSGASRAFIEGDVNNQLLFHIGSGVGTDAMIINSAGKVGIGTNIPDTELTVKGVIHTNEVRVDVNAPIAPDYVFEKDYNLLPLSEVEAYVKQNKHLPEVPSAKEMEENGLNLKEMNLLLLKKVEELTLHLIEMKKENEYQKNLYTAQQKEIDKIKMQLK